MDVKKTAIPEGIAMTEFTPVALTRPIVIDDGGLGLLDLLQIVVENLRLLVLGSLLAGLLALGLGFAMAPVFVATTKFMPPQQQSSAAAMLQGLGALGSLAGAATGLKNPADQYVAFLKSRSLQDALVDRFKLTQRYENPVKEDIRAMLGVSVQVASGKDGLITVEVSDKDPKFAADLANAHVEELGKMLSRLAVTEAQQRRVFFEKQLANAKDNLVKAEQALKTVGVSSAVLKASPQAAVEGLAKLKAAITAQEIKLASMRGYLTASSSEFKQALTEMSALRAELLRAEKDEPPGGADGDYIAKYRDFKYQETLFELFAKQFELARVDESREGSVLQVVDAAQPPERKSRPNKGLMAVLAAAAAGILLLIFVFVRHAFRHAAGSSESAEKVARLRQAWRKVLGLA